MRRAASQELGARRSTLAEKLARKERRRDKKRKKQGRGRGDRADDDDAGEHRALIPPNLGIYKYNSSLALRVALGTAGLHL